MLNLPNGRHFLITSSPVGDAHPYVQGVTLNGQPLGRVFLRHEEIRAGGELHFTMGAQANTGWPGAGANPAVTPAVGGVVRS